MVKSKYRDLGLNELRGAFNLSKKDISNIFKITSTENKYLIEELENALAVYLFELEVFKSSHTYADIRLELDEISILSEKLLEKLLNSLPGTKSFLVKGHNELNIDPVYLAKIVTNLDYLKKAADQSVQGLKNKRGRPINAFKLLFVAQVARITIKFTNLVPSPSNNNFVELISLLFKISGKKQDAEIEEIIDLALKQLN
tara:strand:+ start:955 stop:1554 length:600 start_codon:yes stop_codon:yes gene_type:complete